MRFCARMITIMISLCSVMLNQLKSELCLDGWKEVGRVAVSLPPRLMCIYSSFDSSLIISWDPETPFGAEYKLNYSIVSAFRRTHAIEQQGSPPTIKINGTRRQLADIEFQIRAVRSTSQGDAYLPITLKIPGSLKRDPSSYEVFVQPLLNADARSIWRYYIHWYSLLNFPHLTAPEMILLIYNKTHVLQHVTKKRRICVDNLTEGTKYHFCIIHQERDCETTCVSQVVPIYFLHLNDSDKQVRDLRVISTGCHWIQIAWLPPIRSLGLNSSEVPYAYRITLIPSGGEVEKCLIRIFIVQAPWIAEAHLHRLEKSIIDAKLLYPSSCLNVSDPTHLTPLGPWPDWHEFNETSDELGPLNEFTVNLDYLKSDFQYQVIVQPILIGLDYTVSSVDVSTLADSADCHLDLKSISTHETQLSWSVPKMVKTLILRLSSLGDNKLFKFTIRIFQIGRPLDTLNNTCFISDCFELRTESVLFASQPNGQPQRLVCATFRIPYNSTVAYYQHVVSCLLPCKVYEIIVQLYHDESPINDFQCKRRFTLPSSTTRFEYQVTASALSKNLLLLTLPTEPNGTCSTVGYRLSLQYPSTKPVLIEMKNLHKLSEPLIRGSSDAINRCRCYPLLLNVPIIQSANQIDLQIQRISGSRENDVIKKIISIPLPSYDCYMSCTWPLTEHLSFDISPKSRDEIANQPHQIMWYAAGKLHVAKCPTRCQSSSFLRYSQHSFCYLPQSVATCMVPRCDQIALIPCISNVRTPVVNETAFELEWTQAEWNMKTELQELLQDTIVGYVILLNRPSTYDQETTFTCVQAIVLITFPSWKLSGEYDYFGNPFLNSSVQSCTTVNVMSSMLLSVRFHNLAQNAVYHVILMPFNKAGHVGPSRTFRAQTKPSRPCTPTHFHISTVETHAISVTWNLTDGDHCGSPTYIVINYRNIQDSNTERNKFESVYTKNHIRIPSLLACRMYCVSVQLANHVGESDPLSDICEKTKRASFTTVPSLIVRVLEVPYGQIMMLHGDRNIATTEDHITFRLNVLLNYTKTCPVKYEIRYKVYNTIGWQILTSDHHEINIDTGIERGLFYVLKVRAKSTELSPTNPMTTDSLTTNTIKSNFATEDIYFASLWSSPVYVFTGIAPLQFTNFSVEVQQPILQTTRAGQPVLLCLPSSRLESNSQVILLANTNDTKDHKLKRNSLCFHIHWNIKGSLRGLLGFALQLFVKIPPHDYVVSNQNAASETPQNQCVQFIWIPCDDCLGHYSLINANPAVLIQLRQLMDSCKLGRIPASHSGTSRIETDIDTSGFDGLQKQSTLYRLLTPDRLLGQYDHFTSKKYRLFANQTEFYYDFALTISDLESLENNNRLPVHMIATDKSSIFRARREISTYNTRPLEGFLHIYYVSSNDTVRRLIQPWKVNDLNAANSRYFTTVAVISLITGIILFLLLVLLTSFLLVFNAKRRERMRLSQLQRTSSIPDDDDYGLEMEHTNPVIPPRIAKHFIRQPDAISVHDFLNWFDKHSVNGYTDIAMEFKSLQYHAYRQEQYKRLTCHVGHRPENRLRNKYRNLLPFDHNYVRLTKTVSLFESLQECDNSSEAEETKRVDDLAVNNVKNVQNILDDVGSEKYILSNYVNASLIPGRAPGISYCLVDSNRLPRTYIAAQAPTVRTRGLFWQMIWDHRVKLVVMLTRLEENEKEKCALYWPSSDSVIGENESGLNKNSIRIGRFEIQLIVETQFASYVKRRFQLIDKKSSTNDSRQITHLHMVNWSDFSRPTKHDFNTFLTAYWIERRSTGDNEAPVLIHCSAGIGRTGTFICLDQLCHQVRHYLQPNFDLMHFSTNSNDQTMDEPIYVNLKIDASPLRTDDSKEFIEIGSVNQALLSNNSFISDIGKQQHLNFNSRRKRFFFGKRKSDCSIDIYKVVLWLRSHRSNMVQLDEQYIFIFEYLAYFIQQIKRTGTYSEQVYENI